MTIEEKYRLQTSLMINIILKSALQFLAKDERLPDDIRKHILHLTNVAAELMPLTPDEVP